MHPLDLLAIVAHPDDAELTCGGVLAKTAKAGGRVGVLDLTRGELGTRGTPEIRAEEAGRANKVLGISVRESLGLSDANVVNDLASREKLVGALRLRTIATKDRPCGDFPRKLGAGAAESGTRGNADEYDPAVILDLDYWVLMPR